MDKDFITVFLNLYEEFQVWVMQDTHYVDTDFNIDNFYRFLLQKREQKL